MARTVERSKDRKYDINPMVELLVGISTSPTLEEEEEVEQSLRKLVAFHSCCNFLSGWKLTSTLMDSWKRLCPFGHNVWACLWLSPIMDDYHCVKHIRVSFRFGSNKAAKVCCHLSITYHGFFFFFSLFPDSQAESFFCRKAVDSLTYSAVKISCSVHQLIM